MRILFIFFIPFLYQRRKEILSQLKNPNITEYDKMIIVRKNRDLVDYIRKNY